MSSALSEEYIYLVSLCCIHNPSSSAGVTQGSDIHCLLHMCEELHFSGSLFLHYLQGQLGKSQISLFLNSFHLVFW